MRLVTMLAAAVLAAAVLAAAGVAAADSRPGEGYAPDRPFGASDPRGPRVTLESRAIRGPATLPTSPASRPATRAAASKPPRDGDGDAFGGGSNVTLRRTEIKSDGVHVPEVRSVPTTIEEEYERQEAERAAVAARRKASPPAAGQRAATIPASRPAMTAAGTEGDVVGVKLVGRQYDPKSGRVIFEVAVGNKSNKAMTTCRGFVAFDGDAVERPKEYSRGTIMNLPFSVPNDLPVGAVAVVRVFAGRLPSDTDAEIAASAQKVKEVQTASRSRVHIRFSDGVERDID